MSRNGEAKNTHVQSRPMTGPNRHCNSEVVGESQVCASRTTFSSPKDTHLPGIFGAVSFSPFSSIPPRWKEKKDPHLMDGENCSECVGRASKLSLEQKCEPFCDTTGYKLPAKTTTFPCESTNGSVEDITTDPGDQRPSSANVTGLGSISEQEDEVLSISSGNHLSPSSTSSTTLQLARHKGEGDHIPRPPNAFILFRSSWWKKHECLPGHETNHREISRMAGRAWKSLSYEEKKPYIELAGVRKHEHRMRYPGYKFAPSHAHRKSKAREKIVAPKGL